MGAADRRADYRRFVVSRTFPMPLDIQRFLMGNGPLEGVWFGDPHPTRKEQFWWREVIRERAQA